MVWFFSSVVVVVGVVFQSNAGSHEGDRVCFFPGAVRRSFVFLISGSEKLAPNIASGRIDVCIRRRSYACIGEFVGHRCVYSSTNFFVIFSSGFCNFRSMHPSCDTTVMLVISLSFEVCSNCNSCHAFAISPPTGLSFERLEQPRGSDSNYIESPVIVIHNKEL